MKRLMSQDGSGKLRGSGGSELARVAPGGILFDNMEVVNTVNPAAADTAYFDAEVGRAHRRHTSRSKSPTSTPTRSPRRSPRTQYETDERAAASAAEARTSNRSLPRSLSVISLGPLRRKGSKDLSQSLSEDSQQEDLSQFDTASIFEVLQKDDDRLAMLHAVPMWDTLLGLAIRPDHPARLAWDLVIFALVLYSAFAEPFVVSFNEEQGLSVFSIFVDIMFYIDIVLNFHTGFDRGFEVELRKKHIASNYIRSGWFFVDLLATVQWDRILAYSSLTVADDGGTKGALQIRMLRLLRVLRLAKVSRLINRLTSKRSVHTDFIDAMKFFMYVSVVAHVLACFFYLWPVLMSCKMDRKLADAAFLKPTAAAIGWHWSDSCMQSSWRQHYGLETLCHEDGSALDATQASQLTLRICQETQEFDYEVGSVHPWSAREEFAVASLCSSWIGHNASCPYALGSTFEARHCSRCLNAHRLYTDSLYWSLTTMTTIGYGDRGPQTQTELTFVMFAEVFGLFFFALLLQQIQHVNDTLSRRVGKFNNRKNNLVEFLRSNDCDAFDGALTKDTIRFLNFQNSVLSGNAFDGASALFDDLSPSLKNRIEIAVNRPVLEKVRMFGWNPIDWAEEAALRARFNEIDVDNDGVLKKDEIKALFALEQIKLTTAQFEAVWEQMDYLQTGSLNFFEFRKWWTENKYGRATMQKCPDEFLNALALKLHTRAFVPQDYIVDAGQYGYHLTIVLTGSCKILPADDEEEILVESGDREPVFGLQSCLANADWRRVTARTARWKVQAFTYVDTAWVSRSHLLECFQLWPEGIEIAKAISKEHYQLNEDIVCPDGHNMASTSPEPEVASPTFSRDDVVSALKRMRIHDTAAFNAVMAEVFTG